MAGCSQYSLLFQTLIPSRLYDSQRTPVTVLYEYSFMIKCSRTVGVVLFSVTYMMYLVRKMHHVVVPVFTLPIDFNLWSFGYSPPCYNRNMKEYSETCVRKPPLRLTLVADVERWLSYKGTCNVILLAKLHGMYLYKTNNFFHINHYLKSVSKVALLHRFHCKVRI